MLPLVSVIMPAYNGEKFIEESIKSIIAQTYCHWELIIVDDCSTDNSLDIVAKYNDEKVLDKILDTNKVTSIPSKIINTTIKY